MGLRRSASARGVIPIPIRPGAIDYSSSAATTTVFRLSSVMRASVLARRWVSAGSRTTNLPEKGPLRLFSVLPAAVEVEVHRFMERPTYLIDRPAAEVHMVAMEVDDRSVQLLTVDVDLTQVAFELHHGSIAILLSVFMTARAGVSGLVGRVRPVEHRPGAVGEPRTQD